MGSGSGRNGKPNPGRVELGPWVYLEVSPGSISFVPLCQAPIADAFTCLLCLLEDPSLGPVSGSEKGTISSSSLTWLAPFTTVREARGRPLVEQGSPVSSMRVGGRECVWTGEPGLHECWGELGLGLRGTVNRGYNCPRPLGVKVCLQFLPL